MQKLKAKYKEKSKIKMQKSKPQIKYQKEKVTLRNSLPEAPIPQF